MKLKFLLIFAVIVLPALITAVCTYNLFGEMDTDYQFRSISMQDWQVPDVDFVLGQSELAGISSDLYFVFILVGLAICVFIICALQRMFGNILISLIGGGTVLAIISMPPISIIDMWVVVLYAIVVLGVVVWRLRR